jgi:hypothetical protein
MVLADAVSERAARPRRPRIGGRFVISCERWKDGFVVTVEGARILRHSSSFPSIFLGTPKERKGSESPADSENGAAIVWRSFGPCGIVNEGPDLTVLEFRSLCTIRISYAGRVLHIGFFPSGATGMGIRLRLGANPSEMVFGAGPSTLYNLKKGGIALSAAEKQPPFSRTPTVFSSTGTWIHLEGSGSSAWRFRPSLTELSCSEMPEEIALGFGKTPAMGMELLTRYKSNKRRGRESGNRGRLPEALLAGILADGGEWVDLQADAALRALPPDSARSRNTADLVRAILSLSLSGEGNVYIPIGGPDSASGGLDRLHSLEIAAFGPLFLICPSPVHLDGAARRLAAASSIYEMLKPYRERCADEWVRDGMPALSHPALRFPAESELWNYDDQYMFGPDLLLAPSADEGSVDEPRTRLLHLPDDEWVHLWTSRRYGGGNVVVDAPAGKPAVFYRSRSDFAPLFDEIRRKATRM